jgi:hypothetical protein
MKAKIDWAKIEQDTAEATGMLWHTLNLLHMSGVSAETVAAAETALERLKAAHEEITRDDRRRAKWFEDNAAMLADAEARKLILEVSPEGEVTAYDRSGAVVSL